MHESMTTDLRSRVEQLLRTELAAEFGINGSLIEVLDVTDAVARVRLGEACASCPANLMSIVNQLEQALHARIPDVEFIEAIA
jgi:Fe-S cluster biogenesis protein NfuA